MSPGYHAYLTSYLPVLTVLVAGIALVAAILSANRLLRPTVPSRQKSLTYECGVDPVGSDWAQVTSGSTSSPTCTSYSRWTPCSCSPGRRCSTRLGAASIAEMGVFIGIVVVGLAYAWRTGVLRWS